MWKFALGLGAGLLIMFAVLVNQASHTPYCPQEDSCGTPDFHTQAWWINGHKVTR